MPPAKRTTTAAKKTAAAVKKAEAAVEHVAEICGRCWPNGWPHLSHSASCEHGTYVRDAAPAGSTDEETPQEQTATDGEKTPEPPATDPKKTEDAPPAGENTGA